jgi:RimJ/RimL family protein N-acetyltransferase
MASLAWPVFDIRITVDDLVLRPFCEADLVEIARVLPYDVELNPQSPVYQRAAADAERPTVIHQDYWRAMGTWTTTDWRLNFLVVQADSVIGAQELEGHDFANLRTVDTASFLVAEKRGQGYGKAMRRAVLALAFGGLGAEYAFTSAWHDNAASLGVSRSLGYTENGWSRHPRGDSADDMAHLRMSRADWQAAGHEAGVTYTGVDAALPYFGL